MMETIMDDDEPPVVTENHRQPTRRPHHTPSSPQKPPEQAASLPLVPPNAVMILGQENKTKHLNVCLVQHRLEEGSEVV
jgi:hypothetical protein